ncbi:conserved domain protein [Ruminococcus sp. CAG:60]|nr:conserved domain protein [Ruminococcus sp. CAG:60]
MDHSYYNFLIGKLHKTLLNSLYRTLNIGFDNDRKLFQIACLDLVKQIIQGKLAFGFLKKTVLVLGNKCCCKVLCFFIVLKGHENLTCVWHIAKAKDLYRSRRASLFYTASLIIHHGTYFTAACACCNKISYMKGTLLYKDGGNRSFTLIQLSLNDKTSCCTVRVGFQLGNLCS